MGKNTHPLPAALAQSISQTKRLLATLVATRQDIDIAIQTASKDDLYVLRTRASLIRSQSWSLDTAIRQLTDQIDKGIEAAQEAVDSGLGAATEVQRTRHKAIDSKPRQRSLPAFIGGGL